MLIGYVSDEHHAALEDVCVELAGDGGRSWEGRSRASGSIHMDVPPGAYEVTLVKRGYGSKRSRVALGAGPAPEQFRLVSDGLAGYVWPKCVRAGERSAFRIHAVEPFKLELFRHGWEREAVPGLGWYDDHGPRAMSQITPDGDYTQRGTHWGRTGYHSTTQRLWADAPARSGLYYLHASTQSGRYFSIPWVVAPAKPTARVAVLASDISWNAYNAFGGRSNYISAQGLPRVPTVNARQDLARYNDPYHRAYAGGPYPPLSFERPEPFNQVGRTEHITDPIEGRHASSMAPAEWRLLGWLESEKVAYDYWGESQLHAGALDLSAYRVLILGPHPEYWTRRMYDRVKRWVFHEGGRLMYLGGNGIDCEVDITDDAMVIHNGVVTSLTIEGMGGESRFAGRHESAAHLLGVVFNVAGIMTAAPYRVVDGSSWVFSGTGLRAGDIFGRDSLHRRCPGGASGHETDKRSPSSPRNTQLLAQGLNPDEGGAEMVCFDVPGGGAVFSSASICYVSSLLVDEHVSKVTANVLRRFLD